MQKIFKINEYLTLKLEEGTTKILIKGKLFKACRYLLLNIPKYEPEKTFHVNNIDEAEEIYSKRHESEEDLIDPETEFIGHCSNLQAWYEHDYNTDLLHRSLAFPLLKKLQAEGDPLAKKVFKDELARRLMNANLKVLLYLCEQDYFHYFSKREIETIRREIDFEKIMLDGLKKLKHNVFFFHKKGMWNIFMYLNVSQKELDVLREQMIDYITSKLEKVYDLRFILNILTNKFLKGFLKKKNQEKIRSYIDYFATFNAVIDSLIDANPNYFVLNYLMSKSRYKYFFNKLNTDQQREIQKKIIDTLFTGSPKTIERLLGEPFLYLLTPTQKTRLKKEFRFDRYLKMSLKTTPEKKLSFIRLGSAYNRVRTAVFTILGHDAADFPTFTVLGQTKPKELIINLLKQDFGFSLYLSIEERMPLFSLKLIEEFISNNELHFVNENAIFKFIRDFEYHTDYINQSDEYLSHRELKHKIKHKIIKTFLTRYYYSKAYKDHFLRDERILLEISNLEISNLLDTEAYKDKSIAEKISFSLRKAFRRFQSHLLEIQRRKSLQRKRDHQIQLSLKRWF
jgi:hypothetical protein